MQEEQLKAIEERWAKATPGNWKWIIRGNSVQSHAVVCHDDSLSLNPQNICSGISPKTGNAQAIASAPTDISLLLAEVRRLQLAEKVCKLMQKNRGGHYCVISKCDTCHTEEVGNAGEVCWTCIEKALKEWEAADNG